MLYEVAGCHFEGAGGDLQGSDPVPQNVGCDFEGAGGDFQNGVETVLHNFECDFEVTEIG